MAKGNQKAYHDGISSQRPGLITTGKDLKQARDNTTLKPVNRVGIPVNRVGVK